MLVATLGSGFMGDVAVDDVVVGAGGCRLRPLAASEGLGYEPISPPTLPPAPTDPPSIYDCAFDEDLCIWFSDSSSVSTRHWITYINTAL